MITNRNKRRTFSINSYQYPNSLILKLANTTNPIKIEKILNKLITPDQSHNEIIIFDDICDSFTIYTEIQYELLKTYIRDEHISVLDLANFINRLLTDGSIQENSKASSELHDTLAGLQAKIDDNEGHKLLFITCDDFDKFPPSRHLRLNDE